MQWKAKVLGVLRSMGWNVRRFPGSSDPSVGRKAMIDKWNVDLVLDIGGNVGDYATELRERGYAGRIVSFEPVKQNFQTLQRRSSADPLWEARYVALGDTDGQTTIHVMGTMSSILPTGSGTEIEMHRTADSAETVALSRLDTIWSELVGTAKRIYLKMDTQGFEMHVLRGLGERLREVRVVESELCLSTSYEGQPYFDEVYHFLTGAGFQMKQVWSYSVDARTASTPDFDGIFERAAD